MKKITFLAFLVIASLGFSQELISNGDFQTGAAGAWYSGGENNPIEIVNQGGNFVFQANVLGVTDPWRVNLSQVVALQDNTTYELNFDAFTDATTGSRPISVSLGQAAGPFAGTTPETANLTSTSQPFQFTITTNFDTSNGGSGSRVIFDMGANLGFVFIDNVSLQEVTTTCDNGMMDGDETGVDCGGSICPACPTCSDGMMNGNETGIDCGGPDCPACPTGPTTPAPTPPLRAPADVVNIYSAAYAGSKTLTGDTFGVADNNSVAAEGSVMGDDYWGITFAGSNGIFIGFNLDTGANANPMTFFHVDYWVEGTPTGGVIDLKWSNHAGGHLTGETNASSHTFAPAGPDGQWYSLDIPITDINVGISNGGIIVPANREVLSQVIFTASGASAAPFQNIYFDNMYFHNNTLLSTDEFNVSEFNVFPNPTNGDWNISSNNAITSVAVFDILGKQVSAFTPNNTDVTIDGSSYKTGIYFARIEGINGSKTIKLIKN